MRQCCKFLFILFRGKQQSRRPERLGGGSALEGENGNLKPHRLDQGDAKTFVFRHRPEEVGGPVVSRELSVIDMARKVDLTIQSQRIRGPVKMRQIRVGGIRSAHKVKTGGWLKLQVAPKNANQILLLLLGGKTADKKQVGPIAL